MIKFSCHCNHVFEFPEDMAGRQVQCPDCHRLVDIPTTDQLAEISEDGTFRVEEPAPQETSRFEEMRRVYAKEKVDVDGVEFDLRQTHEELAAAGTENDIYEFEHHPTAPKYDPETGELIRPLDIVVDPTIAARPSQTPMATNMLDYATPGTGDLPYSPLAQLLSPINLAAMFFVLLAHLFFYLAAFSLYLTCVAILFIGPALVAHYANVIEEIGIEERDELPRFLRHFSILEDIWYPFAHVFLAWMICFGPAVLLWPYWILHGWPLTPAIITVSILDLAGLILFPAVVLTTTTGGSLMNLQPKRVMTVIALIGPKYPLLVLLYFVAFVFYVIGMLTVPIQFILMLAMARHVPIYYRAPVAYGSMIAGIFLMHYFAWLLGLHYRRLHQKFPWVYHQRERIIPGVTTRRYARFVRGFPVQPPKPHG
jgi:hypothetical protein